MKDIIIPVDFSLHSEYALETGAILAKRHDATLHVLHMLEVSDSLYSISNTQNTNEMLFLLALAKKKFEPFLDKDYLKDVKVKSMIKHHKVYKEVDLVAADVDADLIIMGSNGTNISDGIFAGSNAEKMVRNSATPVLIIKTEPSKFRLDNVVLATNLSLKSVPAFAKAKKLCNSIGSTVHPVYINTPGKGFTTSREFNEKRKAFTAAGGDEKVHFVAGVNVEDGLVQIAEEENADCIAVITHARKGLSLFFRGSVSEDLANHSEFPILTFKM
ncbi:universal stress protein [Nonlabens antarcticus]|uniref:universal stress protein n=1 Tax=Nonlabens antarcticus TaxID=392714 RepID=UPI001890C9AE|nr:universal stress protein [Nonlabens antarcticus]